MQPTLFIGAKYRDRRDGTTHTLKNRDGATIVFQDKAVRQDEFIHYFEEVSGESVEGTPSADTGGSTAGNPEGGLDAGGTNPDSQGANRKGKARP